MSGVAAVAAEHRGTGAAGRLESVDWATAARDLEAYGCAVLPRILTADECAGLAGCYETDQVFRSSVVMARHGFGRGEYKYFAYPLPPLVAELRAAMYPPLAKIANRWQETLGTELRYPAAHHEFVDRCHGAGQVRPTPLLLRYGAGDFNCLHQDIYGEHTFPLQVAV